MVLRINPPGVAVLMTAQRVAEVPQEALGEAAAVAAVNLPARA